MSKVSEAVLKARQELPNHMMLSLDEKPTPIVSARWETPPTLSNGHATNNDLTKTKGHGTANGANGHARANGTNRHATQAVTHRLLKPDLDFAPAAPRRDLWKLVRGRFGAPDEHLVSLLSPGSFASEQYRHLRYTLEQLKRKQSVSVIAVCSPAPGEGKTVTALNLAGCLSEGSATRVLVVEGDLRKPSIAKYLKMRLTSPGLADFVSDADRFGLIQTHPRYNLAVFPAGNVKATPQEILKSDRLVEFLQRARSHFDHIIIDCPPLAPVSDCLLIQDLVDGIIVVVRSNGAPREMIESSVRSLDQQKILGVVFNDDKHLSKKYKKRVLGNYGSRL